MEYKKELLKPVSKIKQERIYKMDVIGYGLDLSNEIANNHMKIVMNELGIEENEANKDTNEE